MSKRIYRNRKHAKLYKKYMSIRCFDDWPRIYKDNELNRTLRKRLKRLDEKEIQMQE